MARQWKSGDVAVATVRSEPNVRVMRAAGGWLHQKLPDEQGIWTHTPTTTSDRYVGDARPLVVIDPEDREQVERLAKAMHESDHIAPWHDLHSETRSQIEDAMQDALRSLVADPKPDEPQGLGAVVECNIDGRPGHAIYTGAGWVFRTDGLTDYSVQWGDFTAVRVLSEGWSE